MFQFNTKTLKPPQMKTWTDTHSLMWIDNNAGYHRDKFSLTSAKMFSAYAMTFTSISEQMCMLSSLCTVSLSVDTFNMIFFIALF